MPDDGWLAVCGRDEIPRLGARVVRPDGGEDIALFRSGDDHVFAVVDRCPHRGGPLSQGIVHGRSVTCPLHGWDIGLEDGQAAAPDVGCTRTLQVRELDGRIYLRRDELLAAAAPLARAGCA
ncbi:nitrite reductase small subunit NirD [Luteimonas sp. SJ-92]|uniref:Nitrite reductase small subunit NirD n=1 Tax=Luteimonas salinisoli TaxID=2752307 RepID=A0A853JAP7_9GAMM|nr:nitrite reductase small subunit NirD [Luteimonas salinisoli]NZA26271.1 nitrite reductase small subunit NirD [Luteimonas salinisoli]